MMNLQSGTILAPEFYKKPVLAVAPELLGKFLVRQTGQTAISAMITEVEAYDGPEDLACHASKGRTARTETMFGEGGHWYVYLVYGMHEMLNIVTGEAGYPAAVLIRGLEGINGPGRLTKRFGIGREFNGLPAAIDAGLYIEDRGMTIDPARIKTSPRIGVDYAGPIWSGKPYRFYLEDSV